MNGFCPKEIWPNGCMSEKRITDVDKQEIDEIYCLIESRSDTVVYENIDIPL